MDRAWGSYRGLSWRSVYQLGAPRPWSLTYFYPSRRITFTLTIRRRKTMGSLLPASRSADSISSAPARPSCSCVLFGVALIRTSQFHRIGTRWKTKLS